MWQWLTLIDEADTDLHDDQKPSEHSRKNKQEEPAGSAEDALWGGEGGEIWHQSRCLYDGEGEQRVTIASDLQVMDGRVRGQGGEWKKTLPVAGSAGRSSGPEQWVV